MFEIEDRDIKVMSFDIELWLSRKNLENRAFRYNKQIFLNNNPCCPSSYKTKDGFIESLCNMILIEDESLEDKVRRYIKQVNNIKTGE